MSPANTLRITRLRGTVGTTARWKPAGRIIDGLLHSRKLKADSMNLVSPTLGVMIVVFAFVVGWTVMRKLKR
jgi:hypothetical protein